MTRDVIEVNVDKVVEAFNILSFHNIDAAIFGSALHVVVDDAEI